MWSTIIAILIVLAVVLGVVWFLRLMLTARGATEPGDKAEVPAPLRRGPSASSGAVALDEPDEAADDDLMGQKH